ncbi:RAB11-binding protein RELCH-like isoform X2 [Convolutriloba macropyga]|uniref:RAB11-binding protein RELCH-like isoform X2 n=1 Tax=Convolutriloba macropyga TaxID=536237 RepID=UPI003F5221F6
MLYNLKLLINIIKYFCLIIIKYYLSISRVNFTIDFHEESKNSGNSKEDFEDWDDVGLNTSRPPPLKEIYLKYTTQCTNGKSRSKAANGYAEGTANDSSKGGGIQSANTDHKEIQCNLLSETSNNLNDDAEIKAIVGSETNASHEIDAGGEKTSLLSKSDSAFDPDANRDTDSLAKATSESTGIRNESTDRINVNGETSTEHNASMSDQVNQLEKEIESLKSEVQQMQSQNNLLNNKNVGLENEVIELQANVAKWQQQYGNDLDIKAATISRKNTDNTSERDANDPGIADLVSESVKIDNLDKPEPLLSNRYLVLVKNAIFNSTAGSSSGLTAANLDQEHQSVLDRVNKPEKDLAHVCAKSLPNLVSHVLLQHRIEAIPLIMETVAVHPDQDARMKLLELLFNLVKKPDMRQRHVICQSCLTYARRAGAARVESELLPLCWGQLSEKHVERRILVAETASGLLPYMDRDIACSLVYSILTQLLEDKEQMVVSCALRGLALLLCLMQSEHKFDSYLRLILTHIQSSMETQQTAVRHFLIPCFAYWAIKSTNSEKRKESEGSITEDRENHVERDSELRKEKGKPSDEQLLQSAIFIVVQHMHNLLNETVTSLNQESVTEDNISIESGVSRQSMNQTAFTTAPNGLQSSPDFQTKFNCYCATVEAFMPFLFLQVVLTSPFASKPPPAKELLLSQSEELRIFSRFPQAAISAQDVRSMVSDSSHLAYLVHTFDEYLKETTHPVWPELDWVQTQLLPRLVQILLLLDVNAVPCVNSMSTVCYSLSTVFGRPFTVAKFVPLFKSKFSFDITATEGQDFNNSQFISVLNGSLVPVYAAGVLSTIIDEDTNRATTLNDGSEGEKLKETIGGFLVEMLFIYSVNRAPLLSLRAATIALLSNPSYRPALTESVCSSIINASTQMKLTVCHLLELFTRTVDDLLLTQRVIPALITLSGDADWTIRVATVNCFCSVLALTTTHENTDKVCMQLDSMIDDVSLRAETVRALSRIAHSSVRESIRYDYIFTRVLHIVQQLHTIGNASSDSSSITSIDGPKESSNDSSSRVLVSRLCAHLFNFYSTVCQQCSEYPNEVINASLLPALSKLKLECISFNLNEHVEPLNALIRQLEIQVGIIPVSGSNANSGKAASSSSTVKSEGSNLFSKLKGLAK